MSEMDLSAEARRARRGLAQRALEEYRLPEEYIGQVVDGPLCGCGDTIPPDAPDDCIKCGTCGFLLEESKKGVLSQLTEALRARDEAVDLLKEARLRCSGWTDTDLMAGIVPGMTWPEWQARVDAVLKALDGEGK